MIRKPIFLATLLAALTFTTIGCGDSSDENDKLSNKVWRVEVVAAEFPLKQRLGDNVGFKIKVRNAGDDTIPELSITIDSFNYRSTEEGLADPERPVWVINKVPAGSESSGVNTYRLGRLKPGKTVEAVWRLSAVRAGTHTVKYKIAGDFEGQGKTVLADGSAPEGAFVVTITTVPKPVGP